MDQPDSQLATTPERPSLMKKFISGISSGAFSGIAMISIFTALTFGVAPFLAPLIPAALLTPLIGIAAVTLFGGVMAVKRALSEPEPRAVTQSNDLAATAALLPSIGQSMQPALDAADDAPSATARWTERTGRPGDSQSRIQSILANGTMSDRDRATAILAEREAGRTQSASVI